MITKPLAQIVKDYYLKGRLDEDFVMDAVKHTLGGQTTRSSQYDDINNHIDFYWDSPKKGRIGIDVKGIKKNSRHDNQTDDTIQWLELTNVSGKPGWLYGKAEYIAFRTNQRILFSKRHKLLDFILEKIQGKELSSVNPKECYIPYRRKDRQDVIVKVPTQDIMTLTDFSIEFD